MRQSDPGAARPSGHERQDDDLGLDLVDEVAVHRPARRVAPVKKWMLVAAAALVVVAGAVSLFAAFAPRDLASEVAGAGDRIERAVPIDGGGTATLAVAASRDAGAIALTSLPEPPADTAYQVWLVSSGSGGLSSLEVLEPGATDGSSGFSGLADVQAVTVTLEPSGGSEKPSSDPLVSVDLPESGQ
ncbi:MAG: anti-sigma factor [Arthrobacter sp.]|uniref:anti-sigma factor n=1 Tax=Arthrobacter sp. TaxID=1667 RepID=UPI003480EBD1